MSIIWLPQALREEIVRIKASLAEANHRLNQLQAFRGSVARLLHLRDLPEADLLHRLQTLCHAHQEFTLLSHKYDGVSPVPTPCNRFNSGTEHLLSGGGGIGGLPSVGRNEGNREAGRGRSSSISPGINLKRFDDFHEDNFDDELDYGKKY